MTLGLARRALLWAIAGALVGVPLDALHVVTGVLTYRDPDMGLQAWWVIPLFAGAGLTLGLPHRHATIPLAAKLGEARPLPPTTTAGALAGFACLVVAYASSGALQSWPMLALGVYVVIWALIVARIDPAARTALVLHSLGTAAIGPVVEMLISATGAFSYTTPDFLGVAAWLPGIYLNAGAAAHLLDRRLLARS